MPPSGRQLFSFLLLGSYPASVSPNGSWQRRFGKMIPEKRREKRTTTSLLLGCLADRLTGFEELALHDLRDQLARAYVADELELLGHVILQEPAPRPALLQDL